VKESRLAEPHYTREKNVQRGESRRMTSFDLHDTKQSSW